MQHQLIRVVPKVDVVEDDLALQLGVGDGALGPVRVLPGPDIRALLGLDELAVTVELRVHELDVALVLLGLLVHEVEDALRAGGGGDDEVNLHGELAYGLGEALVEARRR